MASQWPYQHVLVMGLGQTGWSAVQFLLSQGVHTTVFDTRRCPPYAEQAQNLAEQSSLLRLAQGALPLCWRADDWPGVDVIVVSPGLDARVSFFVSAQQAGISVIGDVELAMQVLPDVLPDKVLKIIAITGSNGKSTVTEWVTDVLTHLDVPVMAGGNLGQPVLSMLMSATQSPDASSDQPLTWVLELSSFQLETIRSMRPEVAICLNIVADHLDRYADMETYAAVKRRVYHQAKSMVMNHDDVLSVPQNLIQSIPVWRIASQKPLDHNLLERTFYLEVYQGQWYLMLGARRLLAVSDLQVVGHHNYINALAVLAILVAFGQDIDRSVAALGHFSGLPHRCQWVGSWQRVDWFNDSKATNVGASLAGIESLGALQTYSALGVLLGGQGKQGADYAPLVRVVCQYARWVMLFGQARQELALAFDQYQQQIHVYQCETLQQAVQQAKSVAQTGEAVILSPACASFDEFSSYQDRGNRYISWLREPGGDHGAD